ncbi:Glucose-induced degradation protein like [Quillaja saponaria]|uniref:Glucose-induced degradation protein like n=1 Tax=Quillaja saponaria TaxID=32244 RepID=A0AAD7PTK5_QUISA|nr:Glucose-induced degradation protein like [Quillaja saponaria]
MSVFYQEEEEEPQNSSNRCKFLTATLKDAFSNCHIFGGRFSTSSLEDEFPISDFDEEQEVVVSEIRSRATEKLRRKNNFLTNSFSWVYSPKTRELYIVQKEDMDDDMEEDDQREEFLSVKSCFSSCSSALSREAFYSVKTNLSRCSSFNGFEFPHSQRRSIIQEFCHCEGWPFGLCRKALLLPPLPKSPSESWLWRKKQQSI